MTDPTSAQLERLYNEIGPALLGYFRRQPALARTAEDLLQDTFVRALAHPDRLRSSISQRAYLFGIARHVGIDAQRNPLIDGKVPARKAEIILRKAVPGQGDKEKVLSRNWPDAMLESVYTGSEKN